MLGGLSWSVPLLVKNQSVRQNSWMAPLRQHALSFRNEKACCVCAALQIPQKAHHKVPLNKSDCSLNDALVVVAVFHVSSSFSNYCLARLDDEFGITSKSVGFTLLWEYMSNDIMCWWVNNLDLQEKRGSLGEIFLALDSSCVCWPGLYDFCKCVDCNLVAKYHGHPTRVFEWLLYVVHCGGIVFSGEWKWPSRCIIPTLDAKRLFLGINASLIYPKGNNLSYIFKRV